MKKFHFPGFLFIFTFMLLSCSGGETGTGLDKGVVSIGSITGFGSVFINGTHYDTENAQVLIDGQLAQESQLSLGMVVAIRGSRDDDFSGSASALAYESLINGVVQRNANGQLVLMGQNVLYDGATQFDPGQSAWVDVSQVPVDAVVEVSGYYRADNSLQATYIHVEKEQFLGDEALKLKGVITQLDANSFQIGSMEILFDAQTRLPEDSLSLGQFVKVESDRGFVGSQWLAADVYTENQLSLEEGTEFEIEGLITSHETSLQQFVISGVVIHYDNSTQFDTGDAAQLSLNTKLEVEGRVQEDGTFYAEEVEFRREVNVVLTARVQGVDLANSTVSVLGQALSVNNLSVMKDDSDLDIRNFDLSDLLNGDLVLIKAYYDAAVPMQVMVLKRIESQSLQTNVELKGEIVSVDAADSAVVAGVPVMLINNEVGNFLTQEDVGQEMSVDEATFDESSGILSATGYSF